MIIITGFFIFSGTFFFIVGTIGLLRLPDTLSRLHAPTKCDTLGVGLILCGMIIYNGISPATVKLLFLLIFIWLTSPTAASAISRTVRSD